MRALTWVVFVPRVSRQCCALQKPFTDATAVWAYRMHKTTRGSRSFGLHEIFECGHLKFTVYAHKQASKQADIHTTSTNAVMHASVGLAQACPNQQTLQCNIKYMLPYLFLKIEAPAYHKWWGTVTLQPVADNQLHSGSGSWTTMSISVHYWC